MLKPFVSLLLAGCLLMLSGCGNGESAAKEARAGNDTWVADEVLVQLQEIKTELTEIKKQQAEIKTLLEQMPARGAAPSAPVVSSVNLKSSPSASAKVALVEFTDFQCPYCARHSKNVLPQIRHQFVDKGLVHYEVRNFPLDFHAQAKGAAIATLCVPPAQYNTLHDWIFANPGSLNRDAYIDQAKTLGVDAASFAACLDNPATAKAVDDDIAYGEQLGVSGTPKFFVGTIKGKQIVDVSVINGAAEFSRFQNEISKRL